MSHCPANPRFQFIHEERATGSHYVCALCGARRLRAWAPAGANLEITEQMQDDILRPPCKPTTPRREQND